MFNFAIGLDARQMRDAQDDIQKRQAKYEQMTGTPVPKLVLRLAVPTIISMSVSAMYNLVDSYFVGHISTGATAAVGVAFAYQAFIQAIGFFFGSGSGNYLSRALGARDIRGAEKMAATGFFTSLILAIIVAVAGMTALTPMARLLGATDEVLPYAEDYLRYLFLATPFLVSQMSLNNQLRMQGNAFFAMIGVASGAILNVILDPIFIFRMDMGVAGASLATAVSQFVSWCMLLWGTSFQGNVHIHLRNFAPSAERYSEIGAVGLPSLMRQSLGCISTICLNWAAAKYAVPGCEASTIAAFSVVSRVMLCAMSVILGFGQGFQPVCGFNWGAGKYGRVREAYIFTMKTSTTVIILMSVFGYIFAPQVIAFFRSEDPELIRIGTTVLRWQCVAFPFVGVTSPTNMLLQNIRRTVKATLMSASRQGIFFYPALLIAPHLWGLSGLQATMAISDTCTFILSLPFCIGIIRELTQRENGTFGNQ